MTAIHLTGHLFHRDDAEHAGSAPGFPWAWLALVLLVAAVAALAGYLLSRSTVLADAPLQASPLTFTPVWVDTATLTMPEFLQQKRDARAEELPEQF